jgi:(S)-2-hydroxyglutarate dehydrogenase
MPSRAEETVGIVGGGIVGLAVGRELLRRRPGTRVVVFEKQDKVAAHQTGHNSGVVHAGIYYKPGSLKARLCTRGRSLLHEFCAEHDLPYQSCGKLVVAVDAAELGRFDALEKTARQNDVPGLLRVDAAQLQEIEPHARGLMALHSPQTAITDYVAIAEAFAGEITAGGSEIRLSTPVTGIQRAVGGIEVRSERDRHRVDRLVVCAGLQADRVSRQVDGQESPRIVPFRGEYMAVRAGKSSLVRGMVYPVPDPRYPFLGVHFTRRVSGALEVGPNAVLALRREGYTRRSSMSASDLRAMVTWPGFWRMARTHWRTGVTEVRGSLSVQQYMRSAQRYVPEIGAADVVRGGWGIRAQAVDRDGSLVDDFRITESDGVTCVRNAPSPAATSSLAIAELIVDHMEHGDATAPE